MSDIDKQVHMKGSMLDPAANPDVDLGKRRFLIGATAVTGGAIAAGGVYGLGASWAPSEATKAAGASIEINVSKIEQGGKVDGVFWRKQPIAIVHRTDEMLGRVTSKETIKQLADPDSGVAGQQETYAVNETRSLLRKHFVYVSVCTHLGCAPEYRPEVQPVLPTGGFYCPCHGSKFDLAGRVYSGVPAPTNLVVPPYRYRDAAVGNYDVIIVGEDPTPEELNLIQVEREKEAA